MGWGCPGAASRSAATAYTHEPLNPPPPTMTALLFQVVGKFSWNLMGSAPADVAVMLPSTLQYSPNAGAVFTAGTSVAEVTTAEPLGTPISPAATVLPASVGQAWASAI